MTINIDDQLDIFYWLKERADKISSEVQVSEGSTLEKLTQEGGALALLEAAREVLGEEWRNQLADINEKRRIKAHEYDMRTAVEKGVD